MIGADKIFKVPYEVHKNLRKNLLKDFNEQIANTEKVQSLDGFDECYTDIVDYIIRCTHRIWQENNVGLLYTHYGDIEIAVGASKQSHGVKDTIANTLQRLHQLPNRKGIVQNVIWSGNDREGFYTSHRGISMGYNMHDSVHGPASTKKLKFSSCADCESFQNRIGREWLIRDNLYFVSQLGSDPVEVAKRLAREQAAKSGHANTGVNTVLIDQSEPPVFVPEDKVKFDIGDFILQLYNTVHQRKLIGCVQHFYADHANLHFICDKDLIGFRRIRGLLVSFYASFPRAQVIVDRVTCNQTSPKDDDWDVAVRWRVSGLNDGAGYFGKPTGKPVEILIVNHFKVLGGKIMEEWMLFDGLDVLRQMYAES